MSDIEANTEASKDTERGSIEKPKKPRSEKQLAAFKIAQQKRAANVKQRGDAKVLEKAKPPPVI